MTGVVGNRHRVFCGIGSNWICWGNKCTQAATDNLWVLVTGKTSFEVSGSKATFAQEEAEDVPLAKPRAAEALAKMSRLLA